MRFEGFVARFLLFLFSFALETWCEPKVGSRRRIQSGWMTQRVLGIAEESENAGNYFESHRIDSKPPVFAWKRS